jgi:hypothetical protein
MNAEELISDLQANYYDIPVSSEVPIIIQGLLTKIMSDPENPKIISTEDFHSALTDSLKGLSQENDAILLPPNCYIISQSKKTISLNCFYPGKRVDITHQVGQTSQRYNIPFPNVVISQTLNSDENSWVLSSTKYYCVARDPYDAEFPSALDLSLAPGMVWLMPFPNMYEDARMCFGQNTTPQRFPKDNLRGVGVYYSILTNSPFNNDLGVKSVSDRSFASRPASWFAFLASMPGDATFPYDQLIQH